MAVEQGYQTQVNPAQPVGLPQAGADAFGAGIGEGIARVGASLERYDQVKRDVAANEEQAATAVEGERLKTDVEDFERTMKDGTNASSVPGAYGHHDIIMQHFAEQRDALLGKIKDKRVRQNMEVRLASYAGDLEARTAGYEIGKRGEKVGIDTMAYRTALINRTNQKVDLTGALPEALVDFREYVHGLAVPAEQQDALLREGIPTIKAEHALARADDNPAYARQLIAKGVLDDVDPSIVERISRTADAAEHRDAAIQKAREAEALRAQKQAIAEREAMLDTGQGRPQDYYDLAKQKDAVGDTDGAVRARAKGGEQMAALEHRGEPIPQLDARISALEVEKTRSGLSGPKAALLAGLKTERQQQSDLLGQPGGAMLAWARATNRTLTPLDLTDPASLATRGQQSIDAAKRAGRATPEPLFKEDMSGLHDLMENGAGGQSQVLGVLAGLRDPRAIVGAAKQLAGAGDRGFVMAARTLAYPAGQQVAATILRGLTAIKTNPATLSQQGQVSQKAWDENRAQYDFQRWFGPALHDAGTDNYHDSYEGTKAYYAAIMGGHPYDPAKLHAAGQAVLGLNNGRGGHIKYGRSTVIVPPDMTGQSFTQRIARAGAENWKEAASGHVPAWGDGSGKLTPYEAKQMVPRLLDNGRYGLINPADGGLLHNERGGRYEFDPHRLPAR